MPRPFRGDAELPDGPPTDDVDLVVECTPPILEELLASLTTAPPPRCHGGDAAVAAPPDRSGGDVARDVRWADDMRDDVPVLGLLACLELSDEDALLCGLLAVVAVLIDDSGLDLGCCCCCCASP